ncbi:MAG: restriction endonuclease subunit R, partial [Spirochaetota bacterium]|nr:restriction endonuclease subunit R [Spirochaetota bacterium]
GGNWLRIKEHFDDLTPFEQSLLGTSAEKLLQHIEKELRPSRTYKMAVLHSLIEKQAGLEGWDVDEIAEDFKDFYLQNKRYLQDYTAMSREANPAEYPISRVRAHILRMPLNFLSNNEDDFFILDRDAGRFFLKKGQDGKLHQWWNDPAFKQQARDRITYALKTYFYRRNKQG